MKNLIYAQKTLQFEKKNQAIESRRTKAIHLSIQCWNKKIKGKRCNF
jgi:hypothetical protein